MLIDGWYSEGEDWLGKDGGVPAADSAQHIKNERGEIESCVLAGGAVSGG